MQKKAVRANVQLLLAAAFETLERRTLLSHFAHGDDHDDDDHGHDHGSATSRILIHNREIKKGLLQFCPPVPDDYLRDVSLQGGDVDQLATEEIPPFPLTDTFRLHSRPSATKTIYLDFDGQTTSGTSWNGGNTIVTPAYSTDSATSTFSNTELENIQRIWQRVAEDYVPFDVNVTTEEPPLDDLRNTGSGDTRWGIRVIIGGNGAWYGSAGGVAYIGSFDWNSDTPTFVFEDNLGNGNVKFTAEGISHEVGHTLGLLHDGRTTPVEGYYQGHGSGETGWAPIMGVAYYQNLTQWSKGEYANANMLQDDLNIITTQNGFSYRTDDHSNTNAGATFITLGGGGILGQGIIERRTDVDVFGINHSGGEISLNIDPFSPGPNLDIKAELRNSSGAVLATGDSPEQLRATIGINLPAGTYYLYIDGTGKGDPLTTGYTDYGSLGYYKITQNPTVPANDSFSSAIALSGNSVNTGGSSLGGTKQAGEPNHAGNAGGKSVWWNWTAPSSATYVIDTQGSGFNTLLGVYTGNSVSSLTTVVSNDDQTPGSILTSRVTFNASAGTTYRIAVDGYGGLSGSVALSIQPAMHEVSGRVFNDRNSNGIVDGSETGIPGRTVFIDVNGNGVFDSGNNATFHSSDVPKSGDATTIFSNLIVTGAGAVSDVNVTLSITHNWVLDLDVYLISPSGTRVELFTDVGQFDERNFTDTTLDDEAAVSIVDGAAPFTGTFRPEGSLSDFDGEIANGTWKLEVTDDESPDPATLTAWSINLTTQEQTTTTDASGNYTFGNLISGTYNVRQIVSPGSIQTMPTPGGAQVVVLAGGASQTGKNFANFPTAFTGTASSDSYTISTAPGGSGADLQIIEQPASASSITWVVPKATLGAAPLTFNGGGGDDNVTVSHANGNPFSAAAFPITFNGGAGNDVLSVHGSAGDDTITASASAITLGGTVNYVDAETVEVDGKLGLDSVTVSSGNIRFPASQRFQSLDIQSGATATLTAGGSKVLYTNGLTIAGKLDLTDNDLIYDYTGSSPISDVVDLLTSGRNGGDWLGLGIATSAAGASGLTGLGFGEAADVLGLQSGQTGTFSGQTVDSSAILVKYTYAGDANLDGIISGDDYTAIDFAIQIPGATGWSNGDFNYDGIISGDDYTTIDFNILAQGAAL